jgi:hypothetical protein
MAVAVLRLIVPAGRGRDSHVIFVVLHLVLLLLLLLLLLQKLRRRSKRCGCGAQPLAHAQPPQVTARSKVSQ